MNTLRGLKFILNIIFTCLMLINEYECAPKPSEIMVKMKTVKDRIMNGYDKLIRPTSEGSNTTEVQVIFAPRQIIDVDETNGLFSLDSCIWLNWHDPRLQWNVSEYDGTFAFPQNQLWLPDISVYNSHSLSVNPMSEVLLFVMNNGHVVWYPPILTQTSCPAIIERTYPYEEVGCNINLGSWAHDGWEIDYIHVHVSKRHFLNIHSRWEAFIDKAYAVRHVHEFEEVDEPYIELNVTIPMKRRPLPEIEATRIPCILVMLLTLSVFWLPPNSSKKVLVLGFQFLVLTVLIVYVAWSTKFSLGVLSATSFLQSTMYIVVTTFLLQILVIFNLCNLSGPARPPPLAMQLLTGPFGKYVCLRWPLNDNLPMDRVQLKEDSSATIDSPTARDDWMLFAAGLDRLFFVLTSIAMIAVHHL